MITINPGTPPDLDVTIVPREAERLLGLVDDPRQRLMLENFRRHSMLEVSGRWPEIVDPRMTIEHPVYRIAAGGRTEVFDGLDAVSGFYRDLTDSGMNVLFPISERMAVSDWGLTFESQIAHFVPGHLMPALGLEVEDSAPTYLLTQRVCNVWPYSDESLPRLMGENVYIDTGSTEVFALDPSQVITPQDTREILSPMVDALTPYAELGDEFSTKAGR
jgi:hypothetical protein